MNLNNEEQETRKKGINTSSKILLLMIGCIFVIILLLAIILMSSGKTEKFKIYVDDNEMDVNSEILLYTVDDITYVNIEEFSKLVGYEYHKGEYKASTIDENKCYVESKNETSSFYLNENKIYKLAIEKQAEQYAEYEMENSVQSINEKMYLPLEGIQQAFNILVSIPETNDKLQIYTLEYLVKLYDKSVTQWGYASISDQSFENKKALLYGFLIVKKQGTEETTTNGLYKIINTDNTKEIVLDRYTSIEFSENIEGFLVTDTLKKVGIINFDGSTKIENSYDSISLLDKKSSLYIVELNKKYGVVSDKGASLIYPEYDSIGIENIVTENKYLILNELIPVCKDKKWGAFNKNGKLIFDMVYDELGYSLTSVTIEGVKELVKPILAIERANGVVVKKNGKYGLLSTTGEELVPIVVEAIYETSWAENENSKYFMLYNGEELNVIERLIRADKIKKETNNNDDNKEINNSIKDNENKAIENKIDEIYSN